MVGLRGLVASVLAVVEREARSTQVNRPYTTTHGGASPAKHGVIAISTLDGPVRSGARMGRAAHCEMALSVPTAGVILLVSLMQLR